MVINCTLAHLANLLNFGGAVLLRVNLQRIATREGNIAGVATVTDGRGGGTRGRGQSRDGGRRQRLRRRRIRQFLAVVQFMSGVSGTIVEDDIARSTTIVDHRRIALQGEVSARSRHRRVRWGVVRWGVVVGEAAR